jgi:hypothetical protein
MILWIIVRVRVYLVLTVANDLDIGLVTVTWRELMKLPLPN